MEDIGKRVNEEESKKVSDQSKKTWSGVGVKQTELAIQSNKTPVKPKPHDLSKIIPKYKKPEPEPEEKPKTKRRKRRTKKEKEIDDAKK